MSDAIRTRNLVKRFHRLEALVNLTLEVPERAIYALVGPNGPGKTTAIKVLMNIHRPTSGSAEVLGHVSTSLSGQAFTQIGYVSENQELPEWISAIIAGESARQLVASRDIRFSDAICCL
jgi:ABC-2 type transport system ATP-binding protein